MPQNKYFMEQLLELAETRKGFTSPNPVTAAYVVKNDQIIGTGIHQAAGLSHAERLALEEAGSNAEGATLIVNLEPCTHHGQTPPCVDAIIEAKIAHVIYAMDDPNPQVKANPAREILEAAGIQVTSGLLSEKAQYLNDIFVINQRQSRAFVTLKVAMSGDGKIAVPGEKRLLITSEESNKKVHLLRLQHDAICVGANTVINDDPLLTIRHGYSKDHPFTRIVLDLSGVCPDDAALFQSSDPVLIITKEDQATTLADRFRQKASVMGLPTVNGQFSWPQITKQCMRDYGIRSILAEGGQQLISSLIKQQSYDKIITITSPQTIGEDGLFWKQEGTPDPFLGLDYEHMDVGSDRWRWAYRSPRDIAF